MREASASISLIFLCSNPSSTFAMAYPRRVFRLAASSPALLLVEDIESALERWPANVAVRGVFGRLGAFFTCPLAVLFVPFVDTGEVKLIGLANARFSPFPSGVRRQAIFGLDVANRCSYILSGADEVGDVRSV